MKSKSLVAVVDDESAVCKALGRLIRSAGLDVVTFDSGISFLESLGTHELDCLILDIHMPSMTGFEVQAALVAAKVRVPVVFMTGHDSSESRERAMANGAIAYLPKPVDDQMLLRAIEEGLNAGHGTNRN